MISKTAIEEFKNKPLEDYDWIKDLPKNELSEWIKGYEMFTDPYKHQMACFMLGMKLESFLFFIDMGGGKTKLILDILTNRKHKNKLQKTLIITPNDNVMYGWADQVKLHSKDLTYVCIEGKRQRRYDLFTTEQKDLYIITYAGLQVLFCETKTRETYDKKSKSKRILSEKAIKEMFVGFNHLILDESQMVKTPTSLTFKICKHLANKTHYRYGLTGTPMKDVLDLWSQFYLIDKGYTLGTSFSFFKEAFLSCKQGYFAPIWTLPKRNEKWLHKRMKNRSIRYTEEELKLDLPEKVFNTIKFKLSKEQLQDYNKIVQGIKNKNYPSLEIKNIFAALKQITSGFLKIDPEEKIFLPYTNNPKLNAMLELLESVPEGRKVIIYNEFIYSGDLIAALLKKNKYKFTRLYSKTKNKKEEEEKFKYSKDHNILVSNSKSGGVGLNLQVANYVIYYEMPVSPITRKQSIKRAHRSGQTRTVFYYDLLAEKTVEQKIYDNLKNNEDIIDKIIDGKIDLQKLFSVIS